jgi:hypothetical protein
MDRTRVWSRVPLTFNVMSVLPLHTARTYNEVLEAICG